ncbi:hypothetical protein KHQ81_15440 (plasmid) [Mycoplasmatota bacterium]|nr:hypothetical protein KHQ81_15440 [Mycoplasmatota bacterium]
MMNRVVFFSGGKGSFVVACHLKETYPNDNLILYFTDSLIEDQDLYRFLFEASDKLELPLLYHSANTTPIQLMAKQKILFNSRFGNCSKYLKMKVAQDYFKKDKEPVLHQWHNGQYLKNDLFKKAEDTILYFGIDFTEMRRVEPIKQNWSPYKVEFPLVDDVFDYDFYFQKYDIKRPRLYNLGFSHNNCSGKCFKAGVKHFKLLKDKLPKMFEELMCQERHLQIFVSSYHHIKKLDLDDEDKALLYKELDDCYMDYFDGKVNKPKLYIPPNVMYGSLENPSVKKYSFMKRKGQPYTLRDLKRDNNFTQMSLFNNDEIYDIGGCSNCLEK